MTTPQEFVQWVNSHHKKSVLITSHENTDPDGLCGSIALARWLKIKWNCSITLAFDEISKLSKGIVEQFQERVFEKPETGSFDAVFVVDMSSIKQIGKIRDTILDTTYKITVDHHYVDDIALKYFDLALIDTTVSSACELITRIFSADHHIPSPEISSLLLTGLIYDSRRFLYSDNLVFTVVQSLLEWGADYRKAVALLQTQMEQSEKVARIKAAQRMKRLTIGKWIVLTSEVSAFEASACRALIDLGADLAIVYSEKSSEVRLSARGTKEFVTETEIDLAKDLMTPIGPLIQGSGGGHEGAAGANGVANAKEAINRILDILHQRLARQNEN